MRLPRFARRWAVRSDPNYVSRSGPGLVFQSGPFEDKFFWRESSARRHLARQEHATLFRLGWQRDDERR